MVLDHKMLFSLLGIIITIIWYFYYVRDIYKWDNKPHFYSWLIWWIVLLIWFSIQFVHNGGLGSFVTLFEAIFCLGITFIAIKKWEKNITSWDKISLAFAFVSIFFWLVLKNPVISVVLLISIDFFWFFPTFRKAYKKPFEESISPYLAGWIVFTFAIIWLAEYTFLTYAYPLAIIIFDSVLMGMILIRRRVLSK
jgi:hypothetical protein